MSEVTDNTLSSNEKDCTKALWGDEDIVVNASSVIAMSTKDIVEIMEDTDNGNASKCDVNTSANNKMIKDKTGNKDDDASMSSANDYKNLVKQNAATNTKNMTSLHLFNASNDNIVI